MSINHYVWEEYDSIPLKGESPALLCAAVTRMERHFLEGTRVPSDNVALRVFVKEGFLIFQMTAEIKDGAVIRNLRY